jgi:Uncharacterized protein conserved in cyanobacteria
MSIVPKEANLPTYMENGDHLTAEEFLHAWEHMPDVKHAELLEGRVYMNPASVNYSHARPHAIITAWVAIYEAGTPFTETSLTPSVKLDSRNIPEPDVVLRLMDGLGGSSSWENILLGPVELAIEISNTSTSKDVYEKRELYERTGVREYLIWRTAAGEFDHFVREANLTERFERKVYRDGIIKSVVFPGLWLDVEAALAYDTKKVIERLNEGLASPEHASYLQNRSSH